MDTSTRRTIPREYRMTSEDPKDAAATHHHGVNV